MIYHQIHFSEYEYIEPHKRKIPTNHMAFVSFSGFVFNKRDTKPVFERSGMLIQKFSKLIKINVFKTTLFGLLCMEDSFLVSFVSKNAFH